MEYKFFVPNASKPNLDAFLAFTNSRKFSGMKTSTISYDPNTLEFNYMIVGDKLDSAITDIESFINNDFQKTLATKLKDFFTDIFK